MISQLDRDIVFHSKKTLLFNNGAPWSKKQSSNGLFDITMGSYDGAEACELVVCYLLSQLNKEFSRKISLGLYRDDGLAAVYGTSREIQVTSTNPCTHGKAILIVKEMSALIIVVFCKYNLIYAFQ